MYEAANEQEVQDDCSVLSLSKLDFSRVQAIPFQPESPSSGGEPNSEPQIETAYKRMKLTERELMELTEEEMINRQIEEMWDEEEEARQARLYLAAQRQSRSDMSHDRR